MSGGLEGFGVIFQPQQRSEDILNWIRIQFTILLRRVFDVELTVKMNATFENFARKNTVSVHGMVMVKYNSACASTATCTMRTRIGAIILSSINLQAILWHWKILF